MNGTRRVRLALGVMATGALAAAVLPLGSALAATPGPTNLSPDSSTQYAKNVVLSWDDVSGASSYEVQISSSAFSVSGPVLDTTVASNRFVPPVSLPDGDYQWRVRANVSGGTTSWSSAKLLHGWGSTSSSVSASNRVISWDAVPDASYYEARFWGSDGSLKATCRTQYTSVAPYVVTHQGGILPDKQDLFGDCSVDADDYVVEIWAFDGTDQPGQQVFPKPAYSYCGAVDDLCTYLGATGVTYLADDTVPTGPVQANQMASYDDSTLTTPCDDVTACTDSPVLTWNDTQAAKYQVWIGRDPSAIQWDGVYEVQAPQFQVPQSIGDRDLPIYWRVRQWVGGTSGGWSAWTPGNDQSGNPLPGRGTTAFTIDNPVPDSSGSTPTGSTVKSQFVTMTWPVDPGTSQHQAKVWQLQVSKTDDFSDVVSSVTTDRQGDVPGVSTYRFATLADGQLFWRFRSQDETGRWSPWSSDIGFRHDSAVPVVSLSSASGFTGKGSVTLTADSAVDNSTVTSGRMGVQLVGGGKVDGTITKVSSTKWTFTPDGRWVAGATYQAWVDPAVQSGSGISAVAGTNSARAAGLADSSVMKKSGTWKTYGASKAIDGSYIAAKGTGPAASVTFGGSSLQVFACKSPSFGTLSIQVDGGSVVKVNLAASAFTCGKVKTLSVSGSGLHTVVFKSTSSKYVSVDAVKAV